MDRQTEGLTEGQTDGLMDRRVCQNSDLDALIFLRR